MLIVLGIKIYFWGLKKTLMCDVLQYALSDMDREYLSRQLLEGMVYRISKDKISIENANTIFISCERPVLYPRSEFNSMLKTLRELAKNKGVRIKNISSAFKLVKESWDIYKSEVYRNMALYDEIYQDCELLKKRGIHWGCSDDIWLNTVSQKVNTLNVIHHRCHIISQFTCMYYRLKNSIQILRESDSVTLITL